MIKVDYDILLYKKMKNIKNDQITLFQQSVAAFYVAKHLGKLSNTATFCWCTEATVDESRSGEKTHAQTHSYPIS